MPSSNDISPIHAWPDIAGHFTGSDLLLGNGFSRRFTDSFGYESLFDEFLSQLPPDRRASFQALSSTNFELLLESFGEAIRVNHAFGLPTDPLVEAQGILRNGLIETIHGVHPRYADLNAEKLLTVSKALDSFDDVFTLNYDTILYHIIMLAKDRHTEDPAVRPYNDYFWQVLDDDYLEFMDYQNIKKYKHIYYLHGALFLFRKDHLDVKLRRGDFVELIDRIGEVIHEGYAPLFVSEGVTEEKLFAISRSDYLRFAHDHLRTRRKSMVIYGTSFSTPDAHVAQGIRDSTFEAAVSIRVAGKDETTLQNATEHYKTLLYGVHLTFFDADTLF